MCRLGGWDFVFKTRQPCLLAPAVVAVVDVTRVQAALEATRAQAALEATGAQVALEAGVGPFATIRRHAYLLVPDTTIRCGFDPYNMCDPWV